MSQKWKTLAPGKMITGPHWTKRSLCLIACRWIRITELMILPFQIGEARALYNLGNVYHAKGKHFGRNFHQDPGEFPEEVRSALERAIEFYE